MFSCNIQFRRLVKIPNKGICVNAFESGKNKNSSAEYWACAKEHHQSGQEHYHLIIKVGGCIRWEPVKKRLSHQHGIECHFSKKAAGSYINGYRYITKIDRDVVHSENHPSLERITKKVNKTGNMISANMKKRSSSACQSLFPSQSSSEPQMTDAAVISVMFWAAVVSAKQQTR